MHSCIRPYLPHSLSTGSELARRQPGSPGALSDGYDAILDVGGGETPLFRLAQEIPVVSMLGRRGIRLVLAHVIGPEKADLDYLEQFMANGLFVPEATLLILNAGLVLSGRSAVSAFAAIRQHPVLVDALKRGAEIELMPPLACMSQVTDRGLRLRKPRTAERSRDMPPCHSSIRNAWPSGGSGTSRASSGAYLRSGFLR